ncbi:hillarin-like isoform X2 [Ruditapes philippinarum]|nr:hillarin-like isoform X2 [Ruditapes philippinarum]XP_060588208.1 hillarin-like isoform X2 [Ruditapes philippinarum]
MLVDDKAIRIPLTTLSKPIDVLVEYLIEGYDDDLSKVRVLFRWLTNQPINRMHVLEHEPKDKNSALHHLWRLKTQKQRYSKIFSVLCRYAGLYCVIVHGAVKGETYEIGEKIDMGKHYGEWNAVCIDGEWRFIDALWGACDIRDPGDGRGRFKCDERFFFTDPKELIFTHFAETPQWQLLDSPRHIESFEETVCLKNRFFELGMQVLSHPLCEIEAQDGEVEILFGIQPKQVSEQRFNCYISHFDRPETRRYLSNGSNNSVPIFIHKLTDSSISIKVRFPEQGVFRVEIVGKQTNKGSMYKEYDWIAVYKVLVEQSANVGFPKMDAVGWGPGKDIAKVGLVPFNYTSGVIVAKNSITKLRFKIGDTNIVQNMKFFFKMASTYDNDLSINSVSDKFEIDLNIMTFFLEAPPFGEYTLKMYARNVRGNIPMSERKETNICNYLLISDVPQRHSPLGVLTEKTEIAEDSLERSTKMTETKQLTEKKPEVAESIVSASNVMMETRSHPSESIRNSPDGIDDLKTPEPIFREPLAKSEAKQIFVRVDKDLQEIPAIPLNVVRPVHPEIQTTNQKSTDKREMKAISTNKVVPLMSGGDDQSMMLVPVSEKAKRPTTGERRNRTRDDTKYLTALAKVRGEQ